MLCDSVTAPSIARKVEYSLHYTPEQTVDVRIDLESLYEDQRCDRLNRVILEHFDTAEKRGLMQYLLTNSYVPSLTIPSIGYEELLTVNFRVLCNQFDLNYTQISHHMIVYASEIEIGGIMHAFSLSPFI